MTTTPPDPVAETYPTLWYRLPGTGCYIQRRNARPTQAALDAAKAAAVEQQGALRLGGKIVPFQCPCCGDAVARIPDLVAFLEVGACTQCEAFIAERDTSYIVTRLPTLSEVLEQVEHRRANGSPDPTHGLLSAEVDTLFRVAVETDLDRQDRRYTIVMAERYRSIVEKAEPVLRALDAKLVRVGIDPPPKYSGGTWEGAQVLSQEHLHDVRELLDVIGGANAYARRLHEAIERFTERRKAEVAGGLPKRTYTEIMVDERDEARQERDALREQLLAITSDEERCDACGVARGKHDEFGDEPAYWRIEGDQEGWDRCGAWTRVSTHVALQQSREETRTLRDLLREARDQGIAWSHEDDLLDRIKRVLGEAP